MAPIKATIFIMIMREARKAIKMGMPAKIHLYRNAFSLSTNKQTNNKMKHTHRENQESIRCDFTQNINSFKTKT
jgi:hypothetical protein